MTCSPATQIGILHMQGAAMVCLLCRVENSVLGIFSLQSSSIHGQAMHKLAESIMSSKLRHFKLIYPSLHLKGKPLEKQPSKKSNKALENPTGK